MPSSNEECWFKHSVLGRQFFRCRDLPSAVIGLSILFPRWFGTVFLLESTDMTGLKTSSIKRLWRPRLQHWGLVCTLFGTLYPLRPWWFIGFIWSIIFQHGPVQAGVLGRLRYDGAEVLGRRSFVYSGHRPSSRILFSVGV